MVLSSKREHRANTRSMCVLAALTLLVDNIRLPRHRLVEAVDVAEAWLAVVLPQHINHERNALSTVSVTSEPRAIGDFDFRRSISLRASRVSAKLPQLVYVIRKSIIAVTPKTITARVNNETLASVRNLRPNRCQLKSGTPLTLSTSHPPYTGRDA